MLKGHLANIGFISSESRSWYKNGYDSSFQLLRGRSFWLGSKDLARS